MRCKNVRKNIALNNTGGRQSNNGATDSEENDDGDAEVIKIINNTRNKLENDTFIKVH